MSGPAEARFTGTIWSCDEMRAWCEDNNMRPYSRQMERWYFVEEIDGPNGRGNQIQILKGVDSSAARKLMRGELGDYAGWTDERMQGYRSWLRSIIRRGLTSERFGALMQGGLL